MIKILKMKDITVDDVLNRKIEDYGEYENTVKGIIAEVRADGDAALFRFAKKFDGVTLDALEVTEEEKNSAWERVSEDYKAMLQRAAANIVEFHKMQLHDGFEIKRADGTVLGQKYAPLARVGIYVPGGTASYPSTVLMNAVPAKVAGVDEIVMATPPDKEGRVRDEILAAARIAGVDRIFKIGGAGAIAALAFGTESVPAVDKITGPGNIFVALAKKQVFGTVGIDMVAGPSEILVIADEGADADTVAAEKHLPGNRLIKAEHHLKHGRFSAA